MENFDYEITESTTDLDDSDLVYVEISKEVIAKMFADAMETPENPFGEEDDSYESGEIQFIFDKDSENLQEILVFPVYADEDGDGCSNGESFIDAPNSVWEYEDLIQDVVAELRRIR